jgi:hypothetical protein
MNADPCGSVVRSFGAVYALHLGATRTLGPGAAFRIWIRIRSQASPEYQIIQVRNTEIRFGAFVNYFIAQDPDRHGP